MVRIACWLSGILLLWIEGDDTDGEAAYQVILTCALEGAGVAMQSLHDEMLSKLPISLPPGRSRIQTRP